MRKLGFAELSSVSGGIITGSEDQYRYGGIHLWDVYLYEESIALITKPPKFNGISLLEENTLPIFPVCDPCPMHGHGCHLH